MSAKDDISIIQVQTYGHINASATLSDSRANPYVVIDPNASGWWATPLDLDTAIWELMFDRKYLVETIII